MTKEFSDAPQIQQKQLTLDLTLTEAELDSNSRRKKNEKISDKFHQNRWLADFIGTIRHR